MNSLQSIKVLILATYVTAVLTGCQSPQIAHQELPLPVPTKQPERKVSTLLPPNDEQASATITPATPDNTWEIVATGDILLGGSATPILAKVGYSEPFSHYTQILQSADITYGNMEAPAGVSGAPVPDKTFTFQMHPQAIPALAETGFDVVHLANNHMLDYGAAALTETINLVDEHNIKHCGAGKNSDDAREPAVVTTKSGVTIAFLCYSNTFPEEFWATKTKPGTAFGHESWVRRDVAKAVQQWDVVIAAFHWGAELMDHPKDYQQALATAALESGAAAVLGHHPHVLQPVEIKNNHPIAYSLGNFIFGSYSNKVKHSALLRLRGTGPKITEVAVLPIDVYNPSVNFHPHDLPEDQARTVAQFLLGDQVRKQGRWWTITIN